MRSVITCWVLTVTALLFFCTPFMMGQTSATGALGGTVTDPSGALIPNVTVTVINLDTGQQRISTTSTDGSYRFDLLPPGRYRTTFDAAGFRKLEIPSTTVAVTETTVLDGKLQVGATAQSIVVQENAEAVQTETSSLGTVLNTNQIVELPLSTRNYTNLLSLSAGTTANVNNAGNLGKGFQDVAANGASTLRNNFQMDGVSVVNISGDGTLNENGTKGSIPVPNPDSLQEFKIQTSMYDAGYGRTPGANVNVVTKSGTNDFHGDAFEFFRNTALNANEFFYKTSELAAGLPDKPPVLNQNQFGGTFGGPIKKDKLFFFMSFQYTKQVNGFSPWGFSSGLTYFPSTVPGGNRGTCPTPATGISSAAYLASCNAAAQAFAANLGQDLCNLRTGTNAVQKALASTAGNTASSPVQVACNGSNINPVALAMLQVQQGGSYYIPSSNTGQFLTGQSISDPAIYNEPQGMGNLDYVINDKETLAGRFFIRTSPTTGPFSSGINSVSQLVGDPTDFGYLNLATVLRLTTIVSNTLVNEARASFQRNAQSFTPTGPATNSQLGISTANPAENTADYLTDIVVSGMWTAGTNLDTWQQVANSQFQWADQISWVHGKHTVRAGVEAEHIQFFANKAGEGIGQLGISSFSDFLLGLPGCNPTLSAAACTATAGTTTGTAFSNIASASGYRVPPAGVPHPFRTNDFNWFIQDDLKVNPRLTLNLGLRWEYDELFSEANGNNTNVWLSALAQVPVPGTTPATGTLAGFVVPANFQGVIPAGVLQNSLNTPAQNGPPLDNFAPRVGFAWQPTASNRLVVRGGFGYFYDRIPAQLGDIISNPPYSGSLALSGAQNYASTLAVPFVSAPLGWTPRFAAVNPPVGQSNSSNLSVTTIAQNFLTPVTYQWNLNIQYEFLHGWVLELGYVGSHGIRQFDTINGIPSSPPYNVPRLVSASDPATVADGTVTTNTAANASLRVPYLGLSPTNTEVDSNAMYKYNSGQATVRKQFSHGLQLQGAYTFSRAFSGTYQNSPFQLVYEPNPQYHPERFVATYTWDLPFGHPKGILGTLATGWTAAGVTLIQDGVPLDITDSRGGAAYGGAVASAAEFAPGMGVANVGTGGGLQYLNAAAFTTIPNAPGSTATGYGNVGRGILLGPGQWNEDLTIAKVTKVGGLREDATLQFRAEFFNLFNHPVWAFADQIGVNSSANPNLNVASATFGLITTTAGNPRIIQLGLKYSF